MFSFRGSLALFVTAFLFVPFQSVTAQNSSRAAQIRAAQSRGSRIAPLPSQPYRATQRFARTARAAQGSGTTMPLDMSATLSAPIVGTPVVNETYNNVISNGPIVGGGSPVVSDGYIPTMNQNTGAYHGVHGPNGSCSSGGCQRGCCGIAGCSNGFAGGPIGGAGVATACGLPAGYNYQLGQCLFRGIGLLARNTEIFGGAQAFRSRNFFAGDQLIDDSSFGFYGGFNLAVPLQPVTFGLLSGQVGVRSVQSEFDGDLFSSDNRDQLFVTAALYRKVGYGLQFGVAFDFLYEEWFAESDLAQIRGDVGWACPGGCTLGFRFATGTQDHLTSGIINGVAFDDLLVDVVDNYRFYLRRPAAGAGFCDLFAGWSEDEHAVLGLDFDMPVTRSFAMQSGFTYFLPGEQAADDPIVSRDAWNVYVGFSLRPRGVGWYRSGAPMFNVADNGTFIQRR